MAILNIEKSFLTENRSVLDFLNQSGQGLYIPLYQRDYSWDSDNIEQLLEDLTRGIQRIASGEVCDDSKEIRFLGTIITVIEANKNNIYPVDPQAVPSRIEKLIDGQQRVSTIALMATILTKRLTEIRNKIKLSNPIYEQINEICDIWISQKLSVIFSFDLGRGKPRLKPKIVRGAKDFWTREKEVDEAYKSELSNYLGHFIQAYTDKTAFPCLTKDKYGDTLLYKNGRRIELWLKRTVATAHESQTEEFISAEKIIDNFSQDQLWEFERADLAQIIKEKNEDNKSNYYILCELVQTLAVCHYLLDRCCFTIIQPTDDDWAFDMFQSLNATGTPLTAIETFKPTVVNTVDGEDGYQFKDSNSDKSFKKVEDFLSDATTAQQKNKRTNDFLTSFFVAYDGRTMSTHFSYQRKVLNNVYTQLATYDQKETFVKKMGNYAEFYQNWIKYDGKDNTLFPMTNGLVDADMASMLILFLKETKHKMAITMLGSLYNSVIEQLPNSKESFVEVIKLVAAYYFLWRSTSSNAGLDTTYRDFFKQNDNPTVEKIRNHFKINLEKKEINTLESWKNKAVNYLKYDKTAKEVIRFALLVAAHDTIPDEENRGMIKIGRDNSSKYLCLEKWLSGDLKTIEHIAPQSNKNNLWDEALYDTNITSYQSLGNLTLLPQDLNSSAGNKKWKEKILYYQSVAEKDPTKIGNIEEKAKELNIELNSETISLLKNCNFNNHLSSISLLTIDDLWNKELVDKRTDIMLDIIWERISKWIF